MYEFCKDWGWGERRESVYVGRIWGWGKWGVRGKVG